MVALLLMAGRPSLSSADDSVAAVSTSGSGKLTVCRNWLVYNTCTTYNKVALPERVAVGDKLSLSFGSNPKDYTFSVLLIRQQGATCMLLSDANEDTVGGEKIEVDQCQVAANPAVNPR
jgi:hypothetical protein